MKRSPVFFASLALVATGLLSSCDNKSTNSDGGGDSTSTIAAPKFSPAGGTYASAQSVTLSSATDGATIYYTTVLSTPTSLSAQYTGAIKVSATETILAIAVKNGTSSAVASATYTLPPIPWNTSIAYGTFKDSRNSKDYKTVKIGTQTWFAENLNYAGTSAAPVGVCYNSSADSCTKYGRLYTWAEAMSGATSTTASPSGVQGVCPTGWHLPSNAEWLILINYIGGASTGGTELKSTSGWSSSGGGTDIYGFRVVAAGYANGVGSFLNAGIEGSFWSATETDPSLLTGTSNLVYIPPLLGAPPVAAYDMAWDFGNSFAIADLSLTTPKIDGISVRCLK